MNHFLILFSLNEFAECINEIAKIIDPEKYIGMARKPIQYNKK
jgi:hypothetical protein|nr:hypothetical protein [Carnobacterium maltaromaticum]